MNYKVLHDAALALLTVSKTLLEEHERTSKEGVKQLDDLLRLRDKLSLAEVNVAACRTDQDYRNRRAAEEKFQEAYDKFIVDVLGAPNPNEGG